MAGKQDPKRLAILLGILGVIVVGVIAFAVLSGGGDEETATSTTGATAPESTMEGGESEATGPATTGPEDVTPDDETFDVFATKNPFEPVISEISDGGVTGGGTDGGTGGTTPTTSGTTSPTVPGATTTTLPFTGGGGGGTVPSVEPVAPEAVALLDIFDENGQRMARVRVGSTVYTVGVGDTFATSYRVVSIGDTCAQFLFGDDPFELCEGEEVVK